MRPIPGPILLLTLPLLAALVAYLVRRWAVLSAGLSAVVTGVLATLCFILPLDQSALVLGQEVSFGHPVIILGRSLVLDSAGQLWLAFVFGTATIVFLLAWRLPQGRVFFPFSLATLSLYALVSMLQTFSLAVLAFAMSTTPTVFALLAGRGDGAERPGSVRGAQRYLLATLLAVPLLVAAAWLVEQSVLNPENVEMVRLALLPTALGFGLLLALFPFGTWMPAVAADAPPLATALLFTGGQAMALFLAFVFLRDSPLTLQDPAVGDAILLSGLVMAASGGAMAAVQRDLGRLFGYASLSDLGYLLLATIAGGSQGPVLALLHMIGRAASITLLASSLSVIRQHATSDSFEKLKGVARRLPIASVGLVLGGLALAGFPLTAGFPAHWAVNRSVWNLVQPLGALMEGVPVGGDITASPAWLQALTLLAFLASSAGTTIGALRGLGAMLGAGTGGEGARQPILASLAILILIAIVVVLGLYPQLALQPVQEAAQALQPL